MPRFETPCLEMAIFQTVITVASEQGKIGQGYLTVALKSNVPLISVSHFVIWTVALVK